MDPKRAKPDTLRELTRTELEALVVKQSELIEQLRKQVAELVRKGHRQASPFSKNKPTANPKRPGRKRGQGVITNRPGPPEQPTDQKVEASTPEQCPGCGGEVDWELTDTATVTDMPQKPDPVVVRYTVPVCRCKKCGQRVRGQAPGLAPDQMGATAHRLGPGVMAMAHLLHHDLGIPVRKVPMVLSAMTDIAVTASAITQDAMRKGAGPVGIAYEQLRDEMKDSPVVHTDDTGWRIGGRNVFLMGFDSDQSVVYQIRFQHRNEEVREILPSGFGGVLVTDRGVSYAAKAFDGMKQQKCIGHLLRNISAVLETKAGPARGFGMRLKALFQEAMQLAKSPPGESRMEPVRDLEDRLVWHLRNRCLKDDDNQRLLNGIGIQMDRNRILTFLTLPGIEPTNNRAERILRPAVIARKVSHCSKNERGAYAQSAFLSVIQTGRKGIALGLSSHLTAVRSVVTQTR